ncbi:MAG: hypothetical protein M3O70_18630 [Actinomycetota bacterium]|nr:hypothetical protein [Actinomycetota bacterium]
MVATVPGIGETMYVSPFTDDPDRWERLDWFDRRNATRVRLVRYTRPFEDVENWLEAPNPEYLPLRKAKTYAQVLREWADNPESKLAGPDGEPCRAKIVGLLRRRHVRLSAETTWYRGRGNLSDDDTFDAAEEARASLYHDPTLTVVRRAVEAIGVGTVAELTKAKPRTVRRFVAGETLKPSVVCRFVRVAHREANREVGRTRGEVMKVDKLAVINAFLEARRKVTVTDRICGGCGEPFATSDNRQRYHNVACKQRAYRARKRGDDTPDPTRSAPPAATIVR